MKLKALFILTIISTYCFSQKKTCSCATDSAAAATINCRTTTLRNKAKLYWQYNCDSAWLTLQTVKGKKVLLDQLEAGLYYYTFRLGYNLIKEFSNSLLFRSGCPANGPCIYTLIDKNTGRKIKSFGQLICANEETYPFNFLVYFSDSYKQLMVYFVNSRRSIKVLFSTSGLHVIVPEFQFSKMKVIKNRLCLYYQTADGKQHRYYIRLHK